MTEKEWKIIDEEFISYTGGTAQLISNGECKVHLWETPKDAQLFCDKLNEQHKTIQNMKFFITNLEAQRDEFHRGARENGVAYRKYREKVKDTLQKHYNKWDTIGQYAIKDIAEELGVEL